MAAYNFYGGNYGNPYNQNSGYYPSAGFQGQPMMPTQQPMQIPQTPAIQTPQSYSPMMNSSGIIWVSGAQEAQMYPIAPNNAVALWEKTGKTIYLKQADATGKPMITVYDLVERTENTSDTSATSGENNLDFATKDDLGKVVGVVQGINDLLGSIKNDVDTMKGDMYGIAGQKKKSGRKAEAVDDDA